MASVGVSVPGDHTAALRSADTPVVARVHGGCTVLDLRTVDPGADALVAKALTGITAPA